MRLVLALLLALEPAIAAAQQVGQAAPASAAAAGVPSAAVGARGAAAGPVLLRISDASPGLGREPAPLLLPAPAPSTLLGASASAPLGRALARLPAASAQASLAVRGLPARTPIGAAAPLALARARLKGGETRLAAAGSLALEINRGAQTPAEGSRASADRQFAVLTGERRGDGEAVEAGFASDALPLSESGLSRLAPADDEPGAGAAEPRVGAAEITPAPPAASPQDRRNIRLMNFGTGFWKFGAEAVAVGVPLAALHLFGGATFVAGLAVMYGMSQIVSSSVAIGLVERAPPSRVLAGAVAVQAAIVASIFALASAGLLSAWMIFPLYALIGAAHGVAETARRLVPGWILGHDEAALQRYNGGLHVFYEIAGIAGAIAAGAVVLMSSPLAALILEPPAAIIAAFLFSRVHADFEPAPPAPRAGSFGTWAAAAVRGYFADVRQGAAAIFKDPKLAWAALAMIVPAAVHRILEGVLLPVFASKVLALPAAAAWLLSASDTGELLGALLLLAAGSRVKGSSGWVRLMSLGLLAGWIFSVTTSLPLVITLVVASSLTWAASDLSLLSYLQARLPDDVESRAMGFLVGLTVLAMTLGSLGAGRLLDAAGAGTGFVVIGAVLTALAAGLLWVSRKLRQKAGAGSGPRAGNIRQ